MITVTPVPAFTDNYIWVLAAAGEAVAVDPGDAAPLEAHLSSAGLKLAALLITHHHRDHIGGVAALKVAHPGLAVYGPGSIGGITHPVKEGDRIELLGRCLHVLAVPGHTLDHIAYHDGEHLFCGDTLFGAGCGRLFEGTPQQMLHSLEQLAALPDATKVYPAHEYTLSNLRFAQAVEPGNDNIVKRTRQDEGLRTQGLPTLPSTIGTEKQTNPFLRARLPALQASAERQSGKTLADAVAVFATLRQWKNTF